RARITNFRWHYLRHTLASRLVMRGADLRSVQELMGHKTIAMTLRCSHAEPAPDAASDDHIDPNAERSTSPGNQRMDCAGGEPATRCFRARAAAVGGAN